MLLGINVGECTGVCVYDNIYIYIYVDVLHERGCFWKIRRLLQKSRNI